jgi:enamine deaminase RidA (YjgF/YER057c/UK114 family)
MIAIVPSPDWTIEKITLPGQAISASGYNPAVVANDFVFVAGNTASRADGTFAPNVYVAPNRNWGGETAFRRHVHYVVKERLEPSLKAAGSALEHSLAQAHIRGVENFPDFLDVWSQYFREIPCAVTLVPAKDYANSDALLEVNLIALKNGATRRKEVVETGIPSIATFGPCVRAGELVFPSGLIAVGRDGLVPGAKDFGAFDAVNLLGSAGRDVAVIRGCCVQGGRRADIKRRTRAILLSDIRESQASPPPVCRMDANRIPSQRCKSRTDAAASASVIADFWVYAA